MIAKLEFTLPEESHEFKMYSNALNFQIVLHDILEELRVQCKSDIKSSEYKIYSELREMIFKKIEEEGIQEFF